MHLQTMSKPLATGGTEKRMIGHGSVGAVHADQYSSGVIRGGGGLVSR